MSPQTAFEQRRQRRISAAEAECGLWSWLVLLFRGTTRSTLSVSAVHWSAPFCSLLLLLLFWRRSSVQAGGSRVEPVRRPAGQLPPNLTFAIPKSHMGPPSWWAYTQQGTTGCSQVEWWSQIPLTFGSLHTNVENLFHTCAHTLSRPCKCVY